MSVEIRLVPCLSDNYAVLLHDGDVTAVIDAPEAPAIEKTLGKEGWKLTHILITHHHADHVDGIPALKKKYGAKVIGPRADGEIPLVDEKVGEGDTVKVGSMSARVLDTPGHTAGHISYVFDKEKLLFAADTLFVLGCGPRVRKARFSALAVAIKTAPTARRHETLLRPRIHARQCPVRNHGRSA